MEKIAEYARTIAGTFKEKGAFTSSSYAFILAPFLYLTWWSGDTQSFKLVLVVFMFVFSIRALGLAIRIFQPPPKD